MHSLQQGVVRKLISQLYVAKADIVSFVQDPVGTAAGSGGVGIHIFWHVRYISRFLPSFQVLGVFTPRGISAIQEIGGIPFLEIISIVIIKIKSQGDAFV